MTNDDQERRIAVMMGAAAFAAKDQQSMSAPSRLKRITHRSVKRLAQVRDHHRYALTVLALSANVFATVLLALSFEATPSNVSYGQATNQWNGSAFVDLDYTCVNGQITEERIRNGGTIFNSGGGMPCPKDAKPAAAVLHERAYLFYPSLTVIALSNFLQISLLRRSDYH